MDLNEKIDLGDGIIVTLTEIGIIANEIGDFSFSKVKEEIKKRRRKKGV